MERWYAKVTRDKNNFFEPLGEAIEHFWNEYTEAAKEIRPTRSTEIRDISLRIPGIIEYRYAQHQEIEMILRFVELQYEILKGEKKKHFLEHYARSLTDRQADQYADIEPDVIALREFLIEIELIRNRYQGISKGIEALSYQIQNISKLRIAGLEDATL